jgi:hypothetical protein
LSDERAKLSAATNLLEQIQFKKSEYTHLLEAPAYQILETMERQCIQEQKKDITNQVLLLFQQLPRLEQQNLYERLGQIISDQAEE